MHSNGSKNGASAKQQGSAVNGKAKIKVDEEGNKIHGFLCTTLRKLTPPKKRSLTFRHCSESSDINSHRDGCNAETHPDCSFGPLYFCPALNCWRRLPLDDIIEHARLDHSLVISDTPDCHTNSIEIGTDDLGETCEGSAAWAPTLLSAFGTTFFFETWREEGGKWLMWVYHLGTPEESQGFLADLEISNGNLRLAYSGGQVFSLAVSREMVISTGRCLSFADGMAQSMLQPLDERGLSGICYSVRVRCREDDRRHSATQF